MARLHTTWDDGDTWHPDVTPRLVRSMALAPGERLIWSSRRGGKATRSSGPGELFLAFVLALPVLGFYAGFVKMVALRTSHLPAALSWIATIFAAAGLSLPIVAIVASFALPYLRPTYFMTTRRLLVRRLFGGFREVALASTRSIERVVLRYRKKLVLVEEVLTDRARVTTDQGAFELGPSHDIEAVIDLVEHGVLARDLDVELLPSLEGRPSPAEKSEAFFVCAMTRTDGELYGPLFVGSRVILRFSEALPRMLMCMLYVRLGTAPDSETAERVLVDILRSSVAGHYVELPRASTRIALDGSHLRLVRPERGALDMQLHDRDAARLAAYVARR